MAGTARKVRTTITLDPGLAEDARAFGLNVSAVAEAALRQEVRLAKAKAWHEENAEALRLREAWLREHGPVGYEYLPKAVQAVWDEWRRNPDG